jgi:hypothetical protein
MMVSAENPLIAYAPLSELYTLVCHAGEVIDDA